MSGDLESLVRRAQRGDVDAFSSLVERTWTQLVRLARSVVGDADAEDAVQEGLMTAWRKIGSLREPAAFRAWVMRVVSRTCLHAARRRPLAVPLTEVAEPSVPGAAAVEPRIDVERTLAVLAPRQRAVMHLTVIEGMSDSEVGAALGITAGSVRAHRRRARQRLEAVLTRRRPGSEDGTPLRRAWSGGDQ